MVMADRIAVMNQGVLQQVDTPQIIYHNPANVFVGGFIGEPPMNFISCSLSREQNETCFVFDEVRIPCPKKLFARIESVTDTNSVIIGARDTHIELSEKPKEGFVQGKVFFIEPRSEELLVTIEIGKQRILATTGMKTAVAIDAPVWVALDYERCSYFHTETEQNLFG
jgi:ABC-type sugar transport system ATPase subunit